MSTEWPDQLNKADKDFELEDVKYLAFCISIKMLLSINIIMELAQLKIFFLKLY